LEKAKLKLNDPLTDDAIIILNDDRYIEHDAYAMFCKILRITEPWFVTNQNVKFQEKKEDQFGHIVQVIDESANSPIVRKCKHIQNVLLKERDPQLYNYLEVLNIEPQLYCLRWLRLLLGREFHLEDLLIIWDALFAYGKEFELLDHISVGMLMFIRGNIIEKDYSTVMKRLFKYPPVEDVHLFVEKGLQLANQKSAAAIASVKSAVSPPPVHKNYSKALATYTQEKLLQTGQAIAPLASTLKQIWKETPVERVTKQNEELVAELEKYKVKELHLSQRLERIIYSLQVGLANSVDGTTNSATMDAVLLAIAELKQVKDTLLGLLPEGEGNVTEAEEFNRKVASGLVDPLGVTEFHVM